MGGKEIPLNGLKHILLAMTRRERTYQRERDVDDYIYIIIYKKKKVTDHFSGITSDLNRKVQIRRTEERIQSVTEFLYD